MPHHQTQHRDGARSCSRHDGTQRFRPDKATAIATPRNSRIGPIPKREARTIGVAGQGQDRAPRRVPDCRGGRLHLMLSRLSAGDGQLEGTPYAGPLAMRAVAVVGGARSRRARPA